MTELRVQPLTRVSFAPYGDLIVTEGAEHWPINDGTCERFHDLASVEVGAHGRALINVFRALPVALPVRIEALERHPLGSQAFVPLNGARYLVVVAAPDAPDEVVAFLAAGGEGVNYAPGVWHHPLLALDRTSDFLVVDRGGPGDNCDVRTLPTPRVIR